MTTGEMRTFLVDHVPGFNPASSDAAVVADYADYVSGAAAAEPLTLVEVKANLRVTTTDEDDLLAGLIVAAREHVEGATGLVLTPRTMTDTAPTLGRWIDLSAWPVTSVLAVRYPVNGAMTPLANTGYVLSYQRRPVRLLPVMVGWGAAVSAYGAPVLPVEIDVQAGYATPADVPASVKQAMHLLIGHFYSNRAASEVGARAAAVEIPFGVDALLQRWKLARV